MAHPQRYARRMIGKHEPSDKSRSCPRHGGPAASHTAISGVVVAQTAHGVRADDTDVGQSGVPGTGHRSDDCVCHSRGPSRSTGVAGIFLALSAGNLALLLWYMRGMEMVAP